VKNVRALKKGKSLRGVIGFFRSCNGLAAGTGKKGFRKLGDK